MNPMIVQCSSCRTEFELDPVKVPATGVRARCSVCHAVILVPPPTAQPHSVDPDPMPVQAGVPVEALEDPWFRNSPPVPISATSVTTEASYTEAQVVGATTVSAPAVPFQVADMGTNTGEQTLVKRPINPFLSKDPGLRAKRLARALVSDIVAYHPAKHAEGLQAGTLKTLFRDEIKKSYEEYVDQVGGALAESTTHFQDALNDILAAGRKLF